MINAATITKAMQTLLIAALPSTYKVERGVYVNMDADYVPWVGVYRGSLVYDPATLGNASSSWRAEFTIKLIIQASNANESAENTEDDLETYLKAVLDAVMADKTIGGTVAMVQGVNVWTRTE